MPMDIDTCTNGVDELLPPLPTEEARAARKASIRAIVAGIIGHIQDNATVTVPAAGLLAPTPGGPAPVTGSATGTIS